MSEGSTICNYYHNMCLWAAGGNFLELLNSCVDYFVGVRVFVIQFNAHNFLVNLIWFQIVDKGNYRVNII